MQANNWIGTSPKFFDSRNNLVFGSQLAGMNGLEMDKLGLFLYLNAGYCLLGKTPYRNVSFLRANQTLAGSKLLDTNYSFLEKLVSQDTSKVDSALDSISNWVEEMEKTTKGKIVVPLSGGLDSRLLLSMIKDRSRIVAFTYGQSWDESKSNEVKRAEELSKKMGFSWRHIVLNGYSKFTQAWIENRGATSHAHGMYQMEFYSQIERLVPKNSVVLSGIVGDVLAGSLSKVRLSGPNDLWKLTYSHQINASSLMSYIESENLYQEAYNYLSREFEFYEPLFHSKRATDLLTLQNKNMLLRYLVEVPELFGLECRSPFLDEEVGTNLLRLEENERENRKWQKDYLKSIGLDDKSLGKSGLHNNTLNFAEINSRKVDLSLLGTIGIFDEEKKVLEEVKKSIQALQSLYLRMAVMLSQKTLFSLLGRAMLRLQRNKYQSGLSMYYSYLTLIPLSYKGHSNQSDDL
jgi:asparagine synthetase B (glutamine-hydrolysing)